VILIFYHLQTCRLLRSIKSFSKFCHKSFFLPPLSIFFSAFEFLLRPLFFFYGHSGCTIKMKIFGPRHERTANDDRRFKAPTEQVSKDTSRYNATISHEVAKGKRGKSQIVQKLELFLWPVLLSDHAQLCFIPCIIRLISRVESTCGIQWTCH